MQIINRSKDLFFIQKFNIATKNDLVETLQDRNVSREQKITLQLCSSQTDILRRSVT